MYLSFGGRVGQDPELKTIPTGSTVCNFSVAVSGYDRGSRQKTTTWVRIAIWGKRGEQLASLIEKGSIVSITGAFKMREHNGKTYLEVETNDVTLLGSPPRDRDEDDDDEPPRRQQSGSTRRKDQPARAKSASSGDFDDDDVPF